MPTFNTFLLSVLPILLFESVANIRGGKWAKCSQVPFNRQMFGDLSSEKA